MNKLQYIKEFGINLFIIKSIRKIFLNNNSNFAWKINTLNEKKIEKFLIKTIEKSKVKNDVAEIKTPLGTDVTQQPIWVMWYQGLENAPEIVQCCVKSIKEHSQEHEVIVLSESNLHEYVELPNIIMEKFRQGYISRTHLSDMIRLNLLYLYGGAWLDATLFVTNDIPQEYFKENLFSLNFGKKTKDPSHGRWTTFCFFAKKGNTLIEQTLRYHYYYWMQEDYPVDYVMFDYFINYISKDDTEVAKQIENIKPTNVKVFDLIDRLNSPYFGEPITDTDTVFSKLSWKQKYMSTVGGDQTIYGYILDKYLSREHRLEGIRSYRKGMSQL